MSAFRMNPGHRGLRSYVWTWRHTVEWLLLLAVSMGAVAWLAPWVSELWFEVLRWAWPRLGLGDASLVRTVNAQPLGIQVEQVRVALEAPLPGATHWWGTLIVSSAMLLASLMMSRERLPLIYLLRILAFLGFVSVLAFEFMTGQVKTDASLLLNDLLDMGGVMLWLMPVVHAMVLYIFPLAWPLKLAATAVSLAFVVISVPLQVGAAASMATLGSSLALVPIYMMGTFLPQIVAQLGIYGYFMSLARPPKD